MPATFTYNKNEKLKSRKLIEALFKNGKSLSAAPLKIIYMQPAEALDFPIKAGVSVSSKNFKKAVQRNRIKRLMREAYRLNKLPLHEVVLKNNKQLALFILYTGKTLPEFILLQQKMIALVDILIKTLDEKVIANT